LREERRARFMATQEAISARRLKRKVGTTLRVLVDSHEGAQALARSGADAPEIDGTVAVTDGEALAVGEFARVRITGASAHDLTGVRA
jgi:ribosomal protein S12 methylthiotransferase